MQESMQNIGGQYWILLKNISTKTLRKSLTEENRINNVA